MTIGKPTAKQRHAWPGVETFIYCHGCNDDGQAHECDDWPMCGICGCVGWIDGAWCVCQPVDDDYESSTAGIMKRGEKWIRLGSLGAITLGPDTCGDGTAPSVGKRPPSIRNLKLSGQLLSILSAI